MIKQTARWKQKDGTTIRICDMTDSHLANTIAMLERAAQKHDDAFAMSPNPFHGDIAFDIVEFAQNAILEGEDETDPANLYPIYDKLCAERDCRISIAKVEPRRGSDVGSDALLATIREHVEKIPCHDCRNVPCWYCELKRLVAIKEVRVSE